MQYLTHEYRLLSTLIIIEELLNLDAENGATTQAWYTANDIAKYNWKTPQYCLKLLKELSDKNLVHISTITRKNGIKVNLFTLSEQGTDYIAENEKLRSAAIWMTVESKQSTVKLLSCLK